MGTALLTTFLARTAQTHQQELGANVVAGSTPYTSYIAQVAVVFREGGMSAVQSTQMAVGYAYQQLLRQASMLAYQNAFALMAAVILLLTPLPFLMRLPKKAEKPLPEDAVAH